MKIKIKKVQIKFYEIIYELKTDICVLKQMLENKIGSNDIFKYMTSKIKVFFPVHEKTKEILC